MNEETLYKEFILDLYRNPLNKKELDSADSAYTEYNPTCGDEIRIQIKLDESKTIADIGYQGEGCAISQAAVSLMTEAVKGKDKVTILAMTLADVEEQLGISIDYTRKKCALIGLTAIQHAIRLT